MVTAAALPVPEMSKASFEVFGVSKSSYWQKPVKGEIGYNWPNDCFIVRLADLLLVARMRCSPALVRSGFRQS